jgi:hypothetical protein
MAARMAMMAMTTSNSIKVNPRRRYAISQLIMSAIMTHPGGRFVQTFPTAQIAVDHGVFSSAIM